VHGNGVQASKQLVKDLAKSPEQKPDYTAARAVRYVFGRPGRVTPRMTVWRSPFVSSNDRTRPDLRRIPVR
jgi:hypothetical protein